MTNETLENKRKRLLFRSGHRGTKEMDLLLGGFAEKHLSDFNPDQLDEYDQLLEYSDPDLYNWMTGREPPPEEVKTMSIFPALEAYKFA